MTDTKKTIIINPELFKSNLNRTNKANRNLTPKKKPNYKPNDVKRTLLNRIKQHQQNTRDANSMDSNKTDEEKFISDFDGSLKYLSELSSDYKKQKNKKKHKKQYTPHFQQVDGNEHNKTIKNREHIETSENVNLTLPMSLKNTDITHSIRPKQNEPPYGNLKGGNKPTFREWKRLTMKNNTVNIQNITNDNEVIPQPPPTPIISSTNQGGRANRIKRRYRRHNSAQNNSVQNYSTTDITDDNKRIKSTTLKNKYVLGKQQNRKVSVLLKNRQTRKNIERERNVLKQKSILEVKHYLRKHGLLKAGSNAPDDVIRKLYESAFLTGDIKNNNKEVLIHNFMSET